MSFEIRHSESFNPVIGSNFKVKQKKNIKVVPVVDHSKTISDWQNFIIANKDIKVDIPVSFSFTKTGKIKIGYSYSDTIKEFTIIDEALSFIKNFITK